MYVYLNIFTVRAATGQSKLEGLECFVGKRLTQKMSGSGFLNLVTGPFLGSKTIRAGTKAVHCTANHEFKA